MKNIGKISKPLFLFLIVIGTLQFFLSSFKDSAPLLLGLFMFFVTSWPNEDERSRSIKASSAYFALILGYTIALLTANLYSHQLLPVQLTNISHFLIVVFAIAIITYHTRMYLTSK